MITKTCSFCSKEFTGYPSTITKFCSPKCRRNQFQKLKRLKPSKKGFYFKNKAEYEGQLIDYPASPNGKAYIGINKEPLMPVPDGHGYLGVVLQDGNRQLIQCHKCGEWLKKLGSKHLVKDGFKDHLEYKSKYSLYLGEGLVADETSLNLTRNFITIKQQQGLRKGNTAEARSKSTETNIISRSSLQWKNKHGNCPEQLKSRMRQFIIDNHELPNSHNRGAALYKAIRRYYGNLSSYMFKIGLPAFSRIGTSYKFVFPDHTVYKFNINQIHDRDELYRLMLQKCPLLAIN